MSEDEHSYHSPITFLFHPLFPPAPHHSQSKGISSEWNNSGFALELLFEVPNVTKPADTEVLSGSPFIEQKWDECRYLEFVWIQLKGYLMCKEMSANFLEFLELWEELACTFIVTNWVFWLIFVFDLFSQMKSSSKMWLLDPSKKVPAFLYPNSLTNFVQVSKEIWWKKIAKKEKGFWWTFALPIPIIYKAQPKCLILCKFHFRCGEH